MRGIAVGLLCLAAGVAAGYLWGSSAAPEGEPLHSQRPPAAAKPAVSAPRGGVTTGALDIDREVERYLYQTPELQRGKGRITGTIRTEDGSPLAGVTVTANLFRMHPNADYTRPGDAPPREKTLKEAMADFVKEYRATEATRSRATTDADGSYVLKGISKGTYWIQAYREGYGLVASDGKTANGAKAGDVLDFVAHRLVKVPVNVLLPNGSLAEQAMIWRQSSGKPGSTGESWMNSRPSIRIPPGVYFLRAVTELPKKMESEETRVEVPPEGFSGTVTLRLAGKPGIEGNVKLPKGALGGDVVVYAAPAGPGERLDRRSLMRGARANVEKEGRYRLEGLPAGHYAVAVCLGNAIVQTKEVDVAGGTARCDFSIDHLDPSLYFVLRVYDPHGSPLTDVALWLQSGRFNRDVDQLKFATGKFWVFLDSPRKRSGRDSIEAVSRDFGVARQEFDPEKIHEVVLRYEEPARLLLQVEGTPEARRRTLYFLSSGWGSGGGATWSLDKKRSPDLRGEVRLGPVAPGDRILSTWVRVGPHDEMEASIEHVTLSAGTKRMRVKAPATYPLTIDTEGIEAGELLVLHRPEDRNVTLRRRVDKEGRVVIQALPEGQYVIACPHGRHGGTLRVNLRAPTTATFRPKHLNAARVKITDPSGIWAKYGLRDGDLVLEIDGKEIESAEQAQSLLSGADASDPVKVLVLRDGDQREYPISLRELQSSKDAGIGGSLEPVDR